MNHTLKLTMIASLAIAGTACTAQQRAMLSSAAESAVVEAGSYSFDATCDALTVTVDGYADGTVFYVTADGAPPLHLRSGSFPGSTYTFDYYVHNYGIYIRSADGTVLTDSQEFNTCR